MVFFKKQTRRMTPTIEPYKVIILVNYAWLHSFFCPISNATAIFHQGWNPLSQNLLPDETLRYTMTEAERQMSAAIMLSSLIIISISSHLLLLPLLPLIPMLSPLMSLLLPPFQLLSSPTKLLHIPHYDPEYLTILDSETREMMNYLEVTAALCFDIIVQHADL